MKVNEFQMAIDKAADGAQQVLVRVEPPLAADIYYDVEYIDADSDCDTIQIVCSARKPAPTKAEKIDRRRKGAKRVSSS